MQRVVQFYICRIVLLCCAASLCKQVDLQSPDKESIKRMKISEEIALEVIKTEPKLDFMKYLISGIEYGSIINRRPASF